MVITGRLVVVAPHISRASKRLMAVVLEPKLHTRQPPNLPTSSSATIPSTPLSNFSMELDRNFG